MALHSNSSWRFWNAPIYQRLLLEDVDIWTYERTTWGGCWSWSKFIFEPLSLWWQARALEHGTVVKKNRRSNIQGWRSPHMNPKLSESFQKWLWMRHSQYDQSCLPALVLNTGRNDKQSPNQHSPLPDWRVSITGISWYRLVIALLSYRMLSAIAPRGFLINWTAPDAKRGLVLKNTFLQMCHRLSSVKIVKPPAEWFPPTSSLIAIGTVQSRHIIVTKKKPNDPI